MAIFRRQTQTLTADEITLLLGLGAAADPNWYEDPRIKAVIYRCREILVSPPDHIRVK